MSNSTTETVTTSSGIELQKGSIGQSIPRKEDQRLVQGQGVFFDDNGGRGSDGLGHRAASAADAIASTMLT